MGREGHLKPQESLACAVTFLPFFPKWTGVAIYTKHGKKLIKESITVDNDCYVGRKIIKIRALVEGRTAPQSFYVSDLLADNGRQEIQDVIDANTNQ